MAYDPNVETEKSLKALEKQIYKEYSRAYEEMSKTADQYFRTLEDRYKIEYEAYQRGAYTKQEFDLWYKTQIERGQGYNHMRDQLAGRMVEANKVASAYINDKTPSIYSLNYNHEAYRIEGAHPSARFDIYDEQTVKRLIEGGNAVEFKTVNPNPVRDYNWNKDQITSALTSGILQGKPIDKIADSFLTVMERNRTSAMRNARTAYTSAQNAGRQESYRSAKRMGITMMKEWLATTDERTRASHGAMDGERVETDQTFSNELMYPADPDGAPEEVYNCRCTMFAVLPDINDEKRETYSDWIKRKEAEMSDKEAKSEKEKELKKAIERWNASHYSQPNVPSNEWDNNLNPRGQIGVVDSDDLYEFVSNELKVSEDTAESLTDAVLMFTDDYFVDVRKYQRGEKVDDYDKIKSISDNLEDYIKKAPRWNGGTTYRGVALSDNDLDSLVEGSKIKGMGGTASWTSDGNTAVQFAEKNVDENRFNAVVFECDTQSKGTGIAHMSMFDWEQEVLCSKDSEYQVVSKQEENGIIYIRLKEGK